MMLLSEQMTGATCWRSLGFNKRQHAWDPTGGKDREPTPQEERVHQQQAWKIRSYPAPSFPVSLPRLYKYRTVWSKAKWFIRKLRLLNLTKWWSFIWSLLILIRHCGFLCFQTSVQETLFSRPHGQLVLSASSLVAMVVISSFEQSVPFRGSNVFRP